MKMNETAFKTYISRRLWVSINDIQVGHTPDLISFHAYVKYKGVEYASYCIVEGGVGFVDGLEEMKNIASDELCKLILDNLSNRQDE